jgi:hypothetical protein
MLCEAEDTAGGDAMLQPHWVIKLHSQNRLLVGNTAYVVQLAVLCLLVCWFAGV